jgi:3-oxoacyl-[acyl-carrier-protein] synthase-3
MAYEIIATGSAVPAARVSNGDLARQLAPVIETSDEWIETHSGINARHIAEDGTTTSSLAIAAARGAIAWAAQKTGEESREITDSIAFIITATATPDYEGFPSVSCLVQDALSAKNAAAFDVGAACTGFIYALETAAALLSRIDIPGKKRALVIGAETLSRITDWTDRSTCVLFGDGAGCVLLERTAAPLEGADARGLIRTILCADGSRWRALVNRSGGSRRLPPVLPPGHIPPSTEPEGFGVAMDGRAVYQFAVQAIVEMTRRLCDPASRSPFPLERIRYIVPHQANARIVKAAADRLDIAEQVFFLNIAEYGNTAAASIPIALHELSERGRLKRGDVLLLIGFGGGLTYGGSIVIW